ncbi:YozQ family protein [Fervidibacillus halotolerans]|uniref:YozQ family protein n=1 Tax=Fervidibacillus halotolerans TaxID=2980027 RepID=A0A9E8M147_9BACI|nr:YozQ family protein [Fervidibacillus halotolerans]WAA13309.1 YozQ family protein [Fervidibacillus halotolerans]
MGNFKQLEMNLEHEVKDKRDERLMGLAITYEQVLDHYRKGTIDEWIQWNKNGKKVE